MTASETFLSRLEKAGRMGEDALLVVILSSMILLAAAQIVMRNFFDFGFIWSDELLRMLVLWIAVGGAVAASRNDKHINVAVLDRFLPDAVKAVTRVVIHVFTAVICGVVAWHSFKFVQTSHEYGDLLMGGVPAWLPQLILPIGFGLICYRYALFAASGLIRLIRGGAGQ
ncbi:MAG: TRAP transporter small permease [Xanthomonadales bacterium]|nr:TRAP transporter small permease [Gammaproteobacteria bacterium]MBT8053228.1 TRAP transporter small permease [Gammaproteobacteria bacterium]NND56820.1 TRAP transporter small permease [Xanthomonadales bacterium]NNK50268.1 TRAP transporter small permease [Xanthomonadales bacterium]